MVTYWKSHSDKTSSGLCKPSRDPEPVSLFGATLGKVPRTIRSLTRAWRRPRTETFMKRLLAKVVASAATVALLAPAGIAAADSTPIPTIPKGTSVVLTTVPKSYVAIALPHRSGGMVWRIARSIDARKLSEVAEQDAGPTVVVVFRTIAVGDVKIVFALTKGDTGSHAFESYTETVHIR